MPTNNIISRSNAHALEVEQTIINEIIQGVAQGSSILPLMTKLPNMTGKQAKMAVLSSLPEAYWVSGDTGLKQTTEMAWKNKFIYAEELAVVVPIPEAVLADSTYNIWGEVKPRIIEQFYKKIDKAIILGDDKPQLWREGLIPSIINTGNSVKPASNNLYTQISNAMGEVEKDGFDVTGLLGSIALKAAFRTGLLDSTGQPLANSEVTSLQRSFARNGAWNDKLAKFIVGDFKQAVYAIRQDIEFKIFDSGVVTDNSGKIIYNLMQQDMVALRVTMRLGWELPNPINALNSDESTRFPFALVEPSTAPTTYNVEFVVKSGTAADSQVVEGAYVDFGGNILKTNASGKATFKSLGEANYTYSVEKDGKKATGTVAVEKAAQTVSVALV